MKLKIAYCSSSDLTGCDLIKEIDVNVLKEYSTLPFDVVKAYSIHKQDNNLIDCVCEYLNIESVQIFYIEFM